MSAPRVRNMKNGGGSRYSRELVKHECPDVDGTFSIRVVNLPWDATKEEIYFTFDKFDSISDVHMPVTKTRLFKGYAFVRFLEFKSALDAIERMDGVPFLGRGMMRKEARKMHVHLVTKTKGEEPSLAGLERGHDDHKGTHFLERFGKSGIILNPKGFGDNRRGRSDGHASETVKDMSKPYMVRKEAYVAYEKQQRRRSAGEEEGERGGRYRRDRSRSPGPSSIRHADIDKARNRLPKEWSDTGNLKPRPMVAPTKSVVYDPYYRETHSSSFRSPDEPDPEPKARKSRQAAKSSDPYRDRSRSRPRGFAGFERREDDPDDRKERSPSPAPRKFYNVWTAPPDPSSPAAKPKQPSPEPSPEPEPEPEPEQELDENDMLLAQIHRNLAAEAAPKGPKRGGRGGVREEEDDFGHRVSAAPTLDVPDDRKGSRGRSGGKDDLGRRFDLNWANQVRGSGKERREEKKQRNKTRNLKLELVNKTAGKKKRKPAKKPGTPKSKRHNLFKNRTKRSPPEGKAGGSGSWKKTDTPKA